MRTHSRAPRWLVHGSILMAIVQVAAAQAAWAADSSTWVGSDKGDWHEASNWDNDVPHGIAHFAMFDDTAPESNAQINLDSFTLLGGITFDNSWLIQIQGSELLSLDNDGAAALLMINGGGTLRIDTDMQLSNAGILAHVASGSNLHLEGSFSTSASPLVLEGGGVLMLGGDRSNWIGPLTIHDGVVRILHVDALGTGSGVDAPTVGEQGSLFINAGLNLDNHIRLDGGTLGAGQSGTAIVSGPIDLLSNSVLANAHHAGVLRVIGGVGGTGDLFIDQGTVRLESINTYSGDTHISGRLEVRPSGSLVGTGDLIVETGGALHVWSAAGSNADVHSVSTGSVLLNGGSLVLENNLNAGTMLHAASTTGALLLRANNSHDITIAGSSSEQAAEGIGIRVLGQAGWFTERTYSGEITLADNGSDQALLLGSRGGLLSVTGNLLSSNDIHDVHIVEGYVILRGNNNTYAGQTSVHDGAVLHVESANGLGTASGDMSDAVVVNSGGSLVILAPIPDSQLIVLRGGRLSGQDLGNDVILEADSFLGGGQFNGNIFGPGDLTIFVDAHMTGSTQLNTANNYTGRTTLAAPNVRVDVNHAQALGNPTESTLLVAGSMVLNADVAHGVTVDGGLLALSDGTHTTPVTLRGGSLAGSRFGATLKSTLVLDGGQSRILSADITGQYAPYLTLESGITGQGDLIIGGNTVVDGLIDHEGDLIIDGFARTVSFNVAPEHSGLFVINAGRADFLTDATLRLRMQGGMLATPEGHTITSADSTLMVRSGEINANLAGLDTIIKTGPDTARLQNIGANNNAAILVEGGVLLLFGEHGAGSTQVGTTIVSETGAAVRIGAGKTIHEPLYLNSALGLHGRGALIYEDSGMATQAGDVNLGAGGSIIGVGGAGELVISGQISGGDFAMQSYRGHGVGVLRLTTDEHTYTGHTYVGMGGAAQGRLILSHDGTLHDTTGITIARHHVLELDNSFFGNHSDRLGDDIPIDLQGGTLVLTSPTTNDSFSDETVGAVTLRSATSTIHTNRPYTAASNELTLTSLSREAGAAVEFLGLVPDHPDYTARVMFAQTPTMEHGILGGWAMVVDRLGSNRNRHFATYDAQQGVHALDTAGRPDTLNGVSGSDNVRLTTTPAAMLADTTINSLQIDTTLPGSPNRSEQIEVDLNGNTLTILSGGLLRTGLGVTEIANGQLTAGNAVAGGELLVGTRDPLHLSADIVDNSANAVGLTFMTSGQFHLSGANTFSGPMHINSSYAGGNPSLTIHHAHSLPDGMDLIMNGGNMNLQQVNETVQLGDVVLISDAQIHGGTVDAASFLLEQGRVAGITGDGALTKVGFGRDVRITTINYTGDIEVYGGTLEFERFVSNALDVYTTTGNITIYDQGIISISSAREQIHGDFELAGGTLSLRGRPNISQQVRHVGTIDVTADSWLNIDQNTAVSQIRLHDDTTLSIATQQVYPLSLEQQLNVGRNSGLHMDVGGVIVGGQLIADHSESSLQLTGRPEAHGDEVGQITLAADNRNFDGDIDIYHLDVTVQHYYGLGTGMTTVFDGGRLFIEAPNVTGDVTLSGGQLITGDNNFVGNIFNAGSINPGSSPGTFTVLGSYVQENDGTLIMEIASPFLADTLYTQQYDMLIVDGTMILDGTLEIHLLHDFMPELDDVFALLQSQQMSGEFENIMLPELIPGLQWDLSQLYVDGTVSIIPEPGTLMILSVFASALFTRRR